MATVKIMKAMDQHFLDTPLGALAAHGTIAFFGAITHASIAHRRGESKGLLDFLLLTFMSSFSGVFIPPACVTTVDLLIVAGGGAGGGGGGGSGNGGLGGNGGSGTVVIKFITASAVNSGFFLAASR